MIFFKKVTFWASLTSILVCVNHYLDNDDKNIILIGLNPFLNAIIYKQPFRSWMAGADDTLLPSVYGLHFASFFLAGLVIDGVVYFYRRRAR